MYEDYRNQRNEKEKSSFKMLKTNCVFFQIVKI